MTDQQGNGRGPIGPVLRFFRRLLPQRVRTRLALLYGSLFLAGGIVLLAVTFALVSNSFRSQPIVTARNPSPALLEACKAKNTVSTPTKGNHKTVPPPSKVSNQCKKAFDIGANDAAAAQRSATLTDLHDYSVISLIGLALLSGALGWVVSGRVLRPVRRITATAQRASDQHLGERLRLNGPRDELKELADTFDEMLDRLDLAFTGQRQFVANASHELRTPLTVMRTAIDVTLAKSTRSPEQLEAMADRVRNAIDQAERTIEALLTLAASTHEGRQREQVDLATAAEDALDQFDPAALELGLHIDSDLQPGPTLGDRVLIERLVANLVQNAVLHNVHDGWLRIRTGARDGQTFVEIANAGAIIPDDLLPHLSDPFRRGAGRVNGQGGVGIGLSIVRSVTKAHDGTLTMVNLPEGGLMVAVSLPAQPPSTEG